MNKPDISHDISEPILFATIYGSRLYGTDGPDSDMDVRGVFLPAKQGLLLGTPPKHYNFKSDRDTSYLSLQYFLQLLTQGETNALDMFFAYTSPTALIQSSPVYEELVANKEKLITINVSKYLGYCRAQALKYSIKGDKIQNYEALKELLDGCASPSSTTLGEWLVHCRVMGPDAGDPLGDPEDYFKNNTHIGRRFKITDRRLGDHAYLLVCDNKERYIMVSGHLFPQNANLNTTKDSIRKCLASYGKRAFNAAEDNGADYKALSHALRVAYQAQMLLKTGEIIFPLPQPMLDVVRSIKFKTTTMSYEDIVDLIEENIRNIEADYLPNSKLRTTPDHDWINNFVLRQYGE